MLWGKSFFFYKKVPMCYIGTIYPRETSPVEFISCFLSLFSFCLCGKEEVTASDNGALCMAILGFTEIIQAGWLVCNFPLHLLTHSSSSQPHARFTEPTANTPVSRCSQLTLACEMGIVPLVQQMEPLSHSSVGHAARAWRAVRGTQED